MRKFLEGKREKRIASFVEREAKSEPMSFLFLSNIFRSSSFIDLDHLAKRKKEIMLVMEEAFGKVKINVIGKKSLRWKG